MHERESFGKKSEGIETRLPLKEELYARSEFFAHRYGMDIKDVFSEFVKLGLKFHKALEDPRSEVFLLDDEGEPAPLVLMPTFVEKEKGSSSKFNLVEARLNLSKNERRRLSKIAKRNNLLTGQVFDNFVEFGLDLTDMMENSTFEDFEIVVRDRKERENSLIFMPICDKNPK